MFCYVSSNLFSIVFPGVPFAIVIESRQQDTKFLSLLLGSYLTAFQARFAEILPQPNLPSLTPSTMLRNLTSVTTSISRGIHSEASRKRFRRMKGRVEYFDPTLWENAVERLLLRYVGFLIVYPVSTWFSDRQSYPFVLIGQIFPILLSLSKSVERTNDNQLFFVDQNSFDFRFHFRFLRSSGFVRHFHYGTLFGICVKHTLNKITGILENRRKRRERSRKIPIKLERICSKSEENQSERCSVPTREAL